MRIIFVTFDHLIGNFLLFISVVRFNPFLLIHLTSWFLQIIHQVFLMNSTGDGVEWLWLKCTPPPWFHHFLIFCNNIIKGVGSLQNFQAQIKETQLRPGVL